MTNDTIVRSSAVVAAGTALSRITGLARVAATTYALGAASLADAYNLANTTPNIVYDLLLGGVLSATLVPVVVDYMGKEDDEGIDVLATVGTVVLAALTLVSILVAPLILDLYTTTAGGDRGDLEDVGVPLLRLLLIQVLFYGLFAIAAAILNARRRFGAAAFAPVLNNVVVCVVLLVFASEVGDAPSAGEVAGDAGLLWLLGFGTTAGIIVMTAALWPALRRSGIRLRWRFQPKHPAVRRVIRLSGWTFGYVAVNQIALAVILALAVEQVGGVSAYSYAFIFFQLPYGLFAVSLMTTYTPELSEAAARGDDRALRARFGEGLRLLSLVVLPAAVGMAVLARPLVEGLLGHGAFGGDAPEVTADVLANFALGLVGYSVYLFALRGFYAQQDTRTPFMLTIVQNGLNLVIAVALVGNYGVQGLAFAYSVSYIFGAVLALGVFRARVGSLGGRTLAGAVARMAAAAAVMGAAVYWASRAVGSPDGAGAVVRLAAGVLLGVVVYGAALLLMKVDEPARLLRRVRG